MRIYIEAYGCTLNRGEAALLADRAAAAGHERIRAPEAADVIIVATCTVIATTERKMLRRLRALARYGRPIIVAGCMAVVGRTEIKNALADHPIIFLPPNRVDTFENVLAEVEPTVSKMAPVRSIEPSEGQPEDRAAIGIVPIASGCLGQCSYCITRLARGTLQSRTLDSIVDHAHELVHNGCCELQVTAQDSAAYGRDPGADMGLRLPDVITRLAALDGRFRLRVGMMDPDTALEILDPLIDAYRHPKVYKFLHLPVQSGSASILEKMRRRYTADDCRRIVDRFRGVFPDFVLATDIIVGFPTETAGQFEASLDLVRDLAPDIVNITRFSPRPGTPAAEMPGQIVSRIVKERSRALTKLRFEISERRNRRFIGRQLAVIVTKPGREGTATMIARDPNYRVVVIDLKEGIDPSLIGTEQTVRVVDAAPVYLLAHRITDLNS